MAYVKLMASIMVVHCCATSDEQVYWDRPLHLIKWLYREVVPVIWFL